LRVQGFLFSSSSRSYFHQQDPTTASQGSRSTRGLFSSVLAKGSRLGSQVLQLTTLPIMGLSALFGPSPPCCQMPPLLRRLLIVSFIKIGASLPGAFVVCRSIHETRSCHVFRLPFDLTGKILCFAAGRKQLRRRDSICKAVQFSRLSSVHPPSISVALRSSELSDLAHFPPLISRPSLATPLGSFNPPFPCIISNCGQTPCRFFFSLSDRPLEDRAYLRRS